MVTEMIVVHDINALASHGGYERMVLLYRGQ